MVGDVPHVAWLTDVSPPDAPDDYDVSGLPGNPVAAGVLGLPDVVGTVVILGGDADNPVDADPVALGLDVSRER